MSEVFAEGTWSADLDGASRFSSTGLPSPVVGMREAWGKEADNWVRLVRAGLDAGWDFTHPPFMQLLPPPGRLTLDVGCGEGRLGRVLQETGYTVIGVDVTVALARAAASHSQRLSVLIADAAHLAVRDQAADLVVAFMSLQDIDDFTGAVHEAARVLERGGHFCFAIVHPLAEAGRFQEDGTFLVDRSYLSVWRYADHLQRKGIEMTFHSEHRPIEAYGRALEEAGFLIEAFREPMPDEATVIATAREERWRRIPNFLMVRARLD